MHVVSVHIGEQSSIFAGINAIAFPVCSYLAISLRGNLRDLSARVDVRIGKSWHCATDEFARQDATCSEHDKSVMIRCMRARAIVAPTGRLDRRADSCADGVLVYMLHKILNRHPLRPTTPTNMLVSFLPNMH